MAAVFRASGVWKTGAFEFRFRSFISYLVPRSAGCHCFLISTLVLFSGLQHYAHITGHEAINVDVEDDDDVTAAAVVSTSAAASSPWSAASGIHCIGDYLVLLSLILVLRVIPLAAA